MNPLPSHVSFQERKKKHSSKNKSSSLPRKAELPTNITHLYLHRIVRVVLTPAIFAVFSFFGVWFYHATNYLTPLAELYECFALVALFLLLVSYIAPSPHEQKQHALHFFANLPRTNREATQLKHGRGSLRWFYVIWIMVFQILPGRLGTTVAAEVVSARGCPTSARYRHAQSAIEFVQFVQTAVCVTGIVMFWRRLRKELKPFRVSVKLLAFKTIVVIQMLQRLVLAALVLARVLRPQLRVSYLDQTVGLNPFLTSCEVFLFSLVFLWAFSPAPYGKKAAAAAAATGTESGGYSGAGGIQHQEKMGFFRALLETLNIWDIVKGCWWRLWIYREIARGDAYGDGQKNLGVVEEDVGPVQGERVGEVKNGNGNGSGAQY